MRLGRTFMNHKILDQLLLARGGRLLSKRVLPRALVTLSLLSACASVEDPLDEILPYAGDSGIQATNSTTQPSAANNNGPTSNVQSYDASTQIPLIPTPFGSDASVARLSDASSDAASVTPVTPSMGRPAESKLPKPKGACPDLKDGTLTVAGARVRMWVGSKAGPAYFYFHGTGTSPDEVNTALPGATSGVRSNGGFVASWDASNSQGTSTGNVWAVWFTGDFDAADQILACAIEKNLVDTARIHVAGYSAGGLQTGAMLFMRSNYIASGIIYSGGKGFGAMGLQDPSNVPAVLGAHGAKGSDALILDFSEWTQNAEKEIKSAGGFAMDCDDGGGHVSSSRLGVGGKALQFLADHPYGARPSPYAGAIPAGFPRPCKVLQ